MASKIWHYYKMAKLTNSLSPMKTKVQLSKFQEQWYPRMEYMA